MRERVTFVFECGILAAGGILVLTSSLVFTQWYEET